MKVLLFSADWPEYMISLANEMAKQCETVLMMPHNYRLTEEHKKCIDKNVSFISFELIDYKSFRQHFKMLKGIIKTLWREKPDILHIQSNGYHLFFWVAFFKPLKTKIVNTIHDPEKHSGDLSSLAVDDSVVTYIMRFFTRKYIVHGDNLIDDLARAYRINRNRIVSIPHGHLEIYKRFQKQTAIESEFNILFFGRIWPYKGLKYFIEAANLVHQKNPDVKFCIAGAGEDIQKYVKLIQHKKSFEIINKKIPIEEVGILFQRASVVILPYTDATQSGVVPVAYAYSKPVIATKVGGLPNVVKEGETGFLVEPKSSQQIADKIIYFLNHPAEKQKMGKRAYEIAHDELSWRRIAFLTTNVYSSL
jgi:glycosyltransferase involved in cell wall biosynthesis